MNNVYLIEKNAKVIATYKREKIAKDRFEVLKLFCNPDNDTLVLIAPDGEIIAEYQKNLSNCINKNALSILTDGQGKS